MLCCLRGWRRVVCWLDNANHAVLRRFAFPPLCNLHDDYLMRQMPSEEETHEDSTRS